MKAFRLRLLFVPVLAVAALAVAVAASAAKKPPKPAPKVTLLHPGPALNTLVKAAQAEGSLNFYTVPTDTIVRRVAEAFTKKYGIKVTWTRFGTTALQDRFAAEVQSGSTSADMLLLSNSTWVGYAVQQGWVTPLSNAGIPGWPKGKVPVYPKKFLTNSGTAIVQLQPSGIMFNKNQVSASDAPKDWNDLLDPKWKGKIILADPTNSPAFVDLWWAVMKKNGGTAFLQKLRAQAIRLYPGVAPLTQALASGEAAIAVPGVPSIFTQLQSSGAPIGMNTPSVTTGPEAVPLVTAKAKHPAAARLFAWYLLTPGAQALLDADPGSVSVWDTTNAPKGYVRVDQSITWKSHDEIYRAFGVS